ncbi:MAG: 16S rRNA (guanine(966)-N(2))-methyltransferase RsmD [Actinomycetota bacterium]
MARPRLRVIAGTAGGRRLTAPAGTTARPTTDRVKESLFGALGDHRLRDASVLDLYAGSGALAIEALSRGAAGALLVEQDADAVAAIERNLEATGFADRARVRRGDVGRLLAGAPPPEAPFALLFLDPPYDTPAVEVAAVLGQVAAPGWLVPGATVVVERGAFGDPPTLPAAWAIAWERAYGDTLVSVATAGEPTA